MWSFYSTRSGGRVSWFGGAQVLKMWLLCLPPPLRRTVKGSRSWRDHGYRIVYYTLLAIFALGSTATVTLFFLTGFGLTKVQKA